MMVKSFSVRERRGTVQLTLFCLTPRGKEKVVKIYFSMPMLEEFVARLRKTVHQLRKGIDERISYIG
jgi:hypothetical protein